MKAADLIYNLINVSNVDISPSGDAIAFEKSSVDWYTGKESCYILVASSSGGMEIRRTDGTQDKHPKFVQNGNFLSFLRSDNMGSSQLMTLDIQEGTLTLIATIKETIHEFCWAPNGKWIAFVSSINNEKISEETLFYQSEVKVITRIKYRNDVLGWMVDRHRQISVINIDVGNVVQVTTGDYENYGVSWSPDSDKIAFISQRDEERDVVDQSGAYIVSADGGEPVCFSEGLFTVSSLVWAPSGDRLAVVGSPREISAGVSIQGWIYVLSREEKPQLLTDDTIKPMAGFPPQGPFTNLVWTDNNDILFIGEVRGKGSVYQLEIDTKLIRRIWGGDLKISSFAVDCSGQTTGLIASSINIPGDVYILGIPSCSAEKITDYNGCYFRGQNISSQKFLVTRSGLEVESRVYFPPDFDSNGKYPLILDIHGGPNGVFMDTFDPLHHLLVCAGYIVLAVNPRGSATYGEDFAMAVLGDWGGEDYYDLMAALDDILKKPYVDASMLGVHGYSYGGYMASWIVGHTERFKAAAVGAPCTDLLSMVGTSDIGVSWGEKQWGGRRELVMEDMLVRSPISYAANVQTPVLLLHGEEDLRCPISQSEQYFVALKRLGKTVEFIRFPGCSHRFIRLGGQARMAAQYMDRVLTWFDLYVSRR